MTQNEAAASAAAPQKVQPNIEARRVVLRWGALVLLTLAAALAALILGAPVPFSDLWSSDAARAEVAHRIFFELRPVRAVAGLLVGASLSVSGASLQAIFRNPLAEPYLLGISAGGALGATIGLAMQSGTARGVGAGPVDAVSVLAFGGSLLAAAAVYALGRGRAASHGGWQIPERGNLLLTGVALSAFLAAMMSLVVAFFNRADLAQQVMFWTLGGLTNVRPEQNWLALGTLVFGLALALSSARDLNALRVSDEEALSLGVSVEALHRRLLFASSLMSAAAVSMAGLIGFVGLLAPHLIRSVFGDNARVLMPASALGGALVLVSCDAIARSIVPPIELPIGIVTALLGVPLFLFLARRN